MSDFFVNVLSDELSLSVVEPDYLTCDAGCFCDCDSANCECDWG